MTGTSSLTCPLPSICTSTQWALRHRDAGTGRRSTMWTEMGPAGCEQGLTASTTGECEALSVSIMESVGL